MSTVEPIRDLGKIRQIENILSKQNPRNCLIFTIGINLGLRISDILNLNVSDVKNKIFINVKEKKTGKYRKIPLNSKLKDMIEKYIKNLNTDEPLFKSKYNNRLERTYIYKVLNDVCKEINLECNVGTHTLRKTFGYHHYKKFKDLAMLQKIFNHSSSQITMRYIGLEQAQIEESYLRLIL